MCNRENILALQKNWKPLISDSPRNTTVEIPLFKLNEIINENVKKKLYAL